MFAIVSQVIAFAILAGGIWLGYRKWVEPHRASLDPKKPFLWTSGLATLVSGIRRVP